MICVWSRIRVALIIEIPALFGGHCNYTFDIFVITKKLCQFRKLQ